VLDHRPSTVAAAAILFETYGPLLTKEALDSKMSYLSPSCLIENVSYLFKFQYCTTCVTF
jgi:cyclin D5, plant